QPGADGGFPENLAERERESRETRYEPHHISRMLDGSGPVKRIVFQNTETKNATGSGNRFVLTDNDAMAKPRTGPSSQRANENERSWLGGRDSNSEQGLFLTWRWRATSGSKRFNHRRFPRSDSFTAVHASPPDSTLVVETFRRRRW